MNLVRMSQLIEKSRIAIDTAKFEKEFEKDIVFNGFPKGCCGDTSEMLACYLNSFGYETIYVCGKLDDQSHAWLVLNNYYVTQPVKKFYTEFADVTRYDAKDVENGLIIDITADQFMEMQGTSVYIGYMDDFHRKFGFSYAREYSGIRDYRLKQLYKKICNYL